MDPDEGGFMGLLMRAAANAAFGVLVAGVALADEVRVKGEALEGEVVGATARGLVFETAYGDGNVVIPWADVEGLDSDNVLVVLHGDEGLSRGRIREVEGGDTLVLERPSGSESIPVSTLFKSFDEASWSDSTLERLRAEYRHWHAALSVSGSLNRGPTNSQSVQFDLGIERKKRPTRYTLDAQYHVADSDDEIGTNSRDQLAKRAFASLRQEYTFAAHAFGFATESVEHDGVDDIDLRSIVRIGAGYRILEGEKGFAAVDLGPSYIYQRNDEDSFSIALGGEGALDLPYGSKLTMRVDYFPSVENFSDFLLTERTVLTMPLLGWLSFRLSAEGIHEGDPADDSRKNRFKGTAGLSVVF